MNSGTLTWETLEEAFEKVKQQGVVAYDYTLLPKDMFYIFTFKGKFATKVAKKGALTIYDEFNKEILW